TDRKSLAPPVPVPVRPRLCPADPAIHGGLFCRTQAGGWPEPAPHLTRPVRRHWPRAAPAEVPPAMLPAAAPAVSAAASAWLRPSCRHLSSHNSCGCPLQESSVLAYTSSIAPKYFD